MSEDPHERRLQALFTRFAGGDRLHKQSLAALCAELQLPPHAPDSLLSTGRDLDFTQFRSRLLHLLASEPTLASAPRSLSPGEEGRSSKPPGLRRCISFPDDGRDPRQDVQINDPKPYRHSVPLDETRLNEFTSHNKLDAYLRLNTAQDRMANIYPTALDEDCVVSQFNDSSRVLPLNVIADMWESAGISHSDRILRDLGFRNDTLRPDDLLNAIEEEIKLTTSDTPPLDCDPLTVLFRAVLIVYRHEIDYAKTVLTQTVAERDKFKTDLSDANRRAVLLADDIDENHLKIETALKSKIKRLEQKHTDELQQIASKFEEEKDCYSLTIANLEKKNLNFENEELKLKTQLNEITIENEHVEKEKTNIQERLSEISEINKRLTKEIKLHASNRDYHVDSSNSSDVNALEQKIRKLSDENILLKDKNDELFVELEELRVKFDKKNISPLSLEDNQNTPSINGIKRRGISPSSSLTEFSGEEESPRISKIRKCHDKNSICDDDKLKTFNSSDLKAFLLDDHKFIKYMLCEEFKSDQLKNIQCENSSRSVTKKDIMTKIVQYFKEQNCDTFTKFLSESRHQSLYLILYFLVCKIKNDINSNLNLANVCMNEELSSDSMIILQEFIKEVNNLNFEYFLKALSDTNELSIDSPDNVMITENIYNTQTEIDRLNETITKLNFKLQSEKNDNERQSDKIVDLEANIESLRNMYEECEEYWSVKLNEERKIFDQEQQISDEKFSDLMAKLSEYEEEFNGSKPKNSFFNTQLSTIDERCSLEKQFNDLEDEFQTYKLEMSDKLELKNKEICSLNEQIIFLQSIANKNLSVINDINDNSLDNNVIPKIENSDIKLEFEEKKSNDIKCEDKAESSHVSNVSPVTSPIEYLWNQKTISSPISKNKSSANQVRDYQNPNYTKEQITASKSNTESIKITANNDSVSPIQKPSSKLMQSIQNNNFYNNNLEGKLEGKILHCSELERTLQGRQKAAPDLVKNKQQMNSKLKLSNNTQANDQENSNLKIAWLEIWCQELQTAFKHQQGYYEGLLQQSLAVHREEVGVLRQKLEASDLLIRDLYVENCHLTGNIKHSM